MAAILGNECDICYEAFNTVDKRPMVISECGHTFCNPCLRNFSILKCPSCNVAINKGQLRPNWHLLGQLEQASQGVAAQAPAGAGQAAQAAAAASPSLGQSLWEVGGKLLSPITGRIYRAVSHLTHAAEVASQPDMEGGKLWQAIQHLNREEKNQAIDLLCQVKDDRGLALQYRTQACLKLGPLYIEKGEFVEAAAVLHQIEENGSPLERDQSYYKFGMAYISSKPDMAIALLTRVINNPAADAECRVTARLGVAKTWILLKQYIKGEAILRALIVNPEAIVFINAVRITLAGSLLSRCELKPSLDLINQVDEQLRIVRWDEDLEDYNMREVGLISERLSKVKNKAASRDCTIC